MAVEEGKKARKKRKAEGETVDERGERRRKKKERRRVAKADAAKGNERSG